MNLVLLRQSDWITAAEVLLRVRRAGHIRTVLRAGLGDTVRVGLTQPPPPRHPYDLVLALPRPKMLRRILRQCAEFGMANLHLLHSARVEKSYSQSPLLQPAALEEALLAGPDGGPAHAGVALP